MRKLVATLALIGGAVSFTACDSFGQAMSSHTGVLARAAGHELKVEDAVSMLAPNTRLPATAEVVTAFANLWVDYTLLATAAAEDSTLMNVDVDPLLRPVFNQELVYKLRDKVIAPDTNITDAQLKAEFEKEQPGAQVKARHILLQIPADATPQQRDSVMKLAQSIRDQAKAGADFAALAKKYSQEPGAAERGGDLGYFTYEQMVPQFSAAAFALKPGEVSDVVETTFGLHVIKVEDKKLADFEKQKDQFRQAYIAKLYQDAEQKYLDSLMQKHNIQVQDGALETARELTKKPETHLSRRAGNRALVKYDSGELTESEYLAVIQSRPPDQRAQLTNLKDDDLKEWLKYLARDELLVKEATAAGFSADKTEEDSLRTRTHEQLRTLAAQLGLSPIHPNEGESKDKAIDRVVKTYLENILSGKSQILPLQALSYSLRDKYDAEVFDRSIPQVVSQVEAKRPAQPGGMPNLTPGAPGQAPQGQPAPQPQGQPAPTPPAPGQGGGH